MAITLLYQSMAYNSILFISIFYFNRAKIAMKLGKLQNRSKLTFNPAASSTFNAEYQSDHKHA